MTGPFTCGAMIVWSRLRGVGCWVLGVGVRTPTPNTQHPTPRSLDHTIIAPHVNGPVMHQESVRDLAQLLEGLLVAVGDRLVGAVAAGHHERDAGVVEEQAVD